MGIRFYCPNGHKLNVKSFLAGKRGICPDCDARFLVPNESGGQVKAIDDSVPPPPPSPFEEINIPGAPAMDLATDVWHMRTGGGEQHGPATTALLKSWIADGKLDRDCWVWRTGWLDWQRASDVFPELGAVMEAVPKLPRKSFVDESVSIKTFDDALTMRDESDVLNAHRRAQRQKRQQVKQVTLILMGLVLVMLVVLVVVLTR